MKKALITGITGQDGSYLAELLLDKGYEVHGIVRRASTFNTSRLDHLYKDPLVDDTKLFLHYGDLADAVQLVKLLYELQPDEIYNLGAQSHVRVSFDIPEYTGDVTGLGAIRILEAIREAGLVEKVRYYQASSSEMYGKVQDVPQTEKTNFYPLSPYGVAKLYAHWITKNYREAYNIFGSNGILFNHESPRRGETFVTKKIIKALVRIKMGHQKQLVLGNLDSKRDWGHARDYVEAMWKILQQKKPNDYVIATGRQYSIRQFINFVTKKLNMRIVWKGKGLNEVGYDALNKKNIVLVDKNYLRPLDVNTLLGNASKARKELKWKPQINIHTLIDEMITEEMNILSNDQ